MCRLWIVYWLLLRLVPRCQSGPQVRMGSRSTHSSLHKMRQSTWNVSLLPWHPVVHPVSASCGAPLGTLRAHASAVSHLLSSSPREDTRRTLPRMTAQAALSGTGSSPHPQFESHRKGYDQKGFCGFRPLQGPSSSFEPPVSGPMDSMGSLMQQVPFGISKGILALGKGSNRPVSPESSVRGNPHHTSTALPLSQEVWAASFRGAAWSTQMYTPRSTSWNLALSVGRFTGASSPVDLAEHMVMGRPFLPWSHSIPAAATCGSYLQTGPGVEELLAKIRDSLFRRPSEIGSLQSSHIAAFRADRNKALTTFAISSLSDEKVALRTQTVNKLIEVIDFLAAMKVEVGARHLAETESELRELLIPRRPGATIRVCRVFMRFQKFNEGDPLSTAGVHPILEVDAGLRGRRLRDSSAHKVGENTLVASMGCLPLLSEF